MIFSMAAHGRNCTEIVRELSAKKILFKSRSWNDVTILDILTNPKYTGCGVWNRRTQRLHTTQRQLDPPLWITKPFAFPAIVDQQTFDRAQATIQKMRDSRWPDEKILKRIRRLLQTKGRLSEGVLLRARGMPCLATIHKHFGTFRQLYERLGYDLDARRTQETFPRSCFCRSEPERGTGDTADRRCIHGLNCVLSAAKDSKGTLLGGEAQSSRGGLHHPLVLPES